MNGLHAAPMLAVDPVTWARVQMAFTLGAHIILVPLGVAWAFITLVANGFGVWRKDTDALLLAQRWSKIMAVTFAVGAVSGTVLSFEFGLLWPAFMGRFGAAFGIPFEIEGIFFFLEAIFIAIYIYGWRRLRPWPHFLSGIPIVVSGIGGTFSVISANAWMNQPSGFTLNSSGRVSTVDPWHVIFNNATGYETVHMVLAAYMVAGFLIASVYAVAMLRGRAARYHRIALLIPFTVAAVCTPAQIVVGDWAARSVANDQPVKFAAIELVPTTSNNVPETLLGYIGADGTVHGGLRVPALASLLTGFSVDTRIQGLEAFPVDDRPAIAEVNFVHIAWDVMVGLGMALLALSGWFAVSWVRRRRPPASRLFLAGVAASGVAAVIAMEAGWMVTEVGRQPWIVNNVMRVADSATSVSGVGIVFAVVAVVYVAVAVATVLVLRGMMQRWRREDVESVAVPYGPSDGAERSAPAT